MIIIIIISYEYQEHVVVVDTVLPTLLVTVLQERPKIYK